MHQHAYEWLESESWNWLKDDGNLWQGLDLGGRYVNYPKNVHDLWQGYNWTIVDNYPDALRVGDSSYIVADAATWTPNREYDLVLCTEVFEHTPHWTSICRTAYKALRDYAPFLITCAGPGRQKHSGIDGGALREDEFYENVLPHKLGYILRLTGFRDIRITYNPHAFDVYGVAIK